MPESDQEEGDCMVGKCSGPATEGGRPPFGPMLCDAHSSANDHNMQTDLTVGQLGAAGTAELEVLHETHWYTCLRAMREHMGDDHKAVVLLATLVETSKEVGRRELTRKPPAGKAA